MKKIIIFIVFISTGLLFSQLVQIESVDLGSRWIATGNIVERQVASDIFVIANSSLGNPNSGVYDFNGEFIDADSLGLTGVNLNPYHISSFKRINNKYYISCCNEVPRIYCFSDTLIWETYTQGHAFDILDSIIVAGGNNGFQYLDPNTGNSISSIINIPLMSDVVSALNEFQVLLLNDGFIVARKVICSNYSVKIQVSKYSRERLLWMDLVEINSFGKFMLFRDQVDSECFILVAGCLINQVEGMTQGVKIIRIWNGMNEIIATINNIEFQHADISHDFNSIAIVGRTIYSNFQQIPIPILIYADNINWYYQNNFDFDIYTMQEYDYDYFTNVYIRHDCNNRLIITSNHKIFSFLIPNVLNEEYTVSGVNNVKIYPNPFQSSVKIVSSVPAKATVYNIKGQKIKSIILDKNIFIWNGRDDNDNCVQSGIYFVKINDITRKIIKY